MKKLITKSLIWTLGCSMTLFVLLFSVKKSFAAKDNCTEESACRKDLPEVKDIEPLWESISHHFVSTVSLISFFDFPQFIQLLHQPITFVGRRLLRYPKKYFSLL
jgi:hypothetical protein